MAQVIYTAVTLCVLLEAAAHVAANHSQSLCHLMAAVIVKQHT